MKNENYREIIRNKVKQSALKLSIGRRWALQHAAIIVKKFFKYNIINALEYAAHSPDLNPMENLWS